MPGADQSDDDKAKSPLSEILAFLYTDPRALAIASTNLASGFKPARAGAQDFDCKAVKCKTTLANALGYPGHTSLIPSKGGLNLAVAADEDLRKLYGIPADSECWKAFKKQHVQAFKDEFTRFANKKPLASADIFPTLDDHLLRRIHALAIEEKYNGDFSQGPVMLACDEWRVEAIELSANKPSNVGVNIKRQSGMPKSADDQFALVTLAPVRKNDPDERQPFDLSLYLGKSAVGLHFRRCTIEFDLGTAEAEEPGDRKAYPGTLEVRRPPTKRPLDKSLTIEPRGGLNTKPAFLVTVTMGKDALGGITADRIIAVKGLVVGQVIKARLKVMLGDLAGPTTGARRK